MYIHTQYIQYICMYIRTYMHTYIHTYMYVCTYDKHTIQGTLYSGHLGTKATVLIIEVSSFQGLKMYYGKV